MEMPFAGTVETGGGSMDGKALSPQDGQNAKVGEMSAEHLGHFAEFGGGETLIG